MIHALRRLTVIPKVDAFCGLLEDHPDRWLALCWYRDSANELFQRVKKSGRPCGYVDGGTSESERRRALSTYNDRPNGVLVGTLGALETGLNLQAGQNIAFIEQHYLSATNDQAVGRLFRRGQQGPVLVYWLHCLKTFDMRVKSVAEKRAEDIDRALDGFLGDEDWSA
jgi:SNF2 family DNA or RNA helicase